MKGLVRSYRKNKRADVIPSSEMFSLFIFLNKSIDHLQYAIPMLYVRRVKGQVYMVSDGVSLNKHVQARF